MSQGNEMGELSSKASGAVAGLIHATTAVASALIELRIARLREAAQQQREQEQAAREQARAFHQGDSAVWRAAMRPAWWRDAGAEDISRVWRAASTWQHVDPRAAEARQVVVERLAERGVRVNPNDGYAPSPDDVRWLSDALDQAAAAQSAARASSAQPGRTRAGGIADPTIIDGEVGPEQRGVDADAAAAAEARRTAEWEQRAEAHVRAAYSPERAERVIGCKAWGALVHELGGLQEQGHDVQTLLRGVPDFVDEAHTPAAFAVRSMRDRVGDMVDLGTVRAGSPVSSAAAVAVPAMTTEQQEQARAGMLQLLGEYHEGAQQSYNYSDTAHGQHAARLDMQSYEELAARIRSATDVDEIFRAGPAEADGRDRTVEALWEIRQAAAGDTAVDRDDLARRAQAAAELVPFGRSEFPTPDERAGIAAAGGAEADDVRAAAVAHWKSRIADQLPQVGTRDGAGLAAAVSGVKFYETAPAEDVFRRLASESPQDQARIVAAAQAMRAAEQERAVAVGERAMERDARAEQRQAEHGDGGRDGDREDRAQRARLAAEDHAARASEHEVRAAQLAADGFPVTTKEAVTAAADAGKARNAGGVEQAAAATRGGARPGLPKRPVAAGKRPDQKTR